MRYYLELLIVVLLFGLGLLNQHRLPHLPSYLGMLAVLGCARLLMPAQMFSGWLRIAWLATVGVTFLGIVCELVL